MDARRIAPFVDALTAALQKYDVEAVCGPMRGGAFLAQLIAKALDVEPIACIAFEPSTFSAAANNGRMIVDVAPRSAATRHFAHIAEKITGRTNGRDKRAGRFAFKRLWGR